MNKLKIFCMSTAISIAASCPVFAQENILDVDATINKAIESSYTIKSQDIKIEKLKINYDDALKNAVKVNRKLDDNDRFKQLRDKGKDRTESEETEYEDCKIKYGRILNTDEKLQQERIRDIVPKQYKYDIYEATNDKEVLKNKVKISVYENYNKLMNTKDSLDLAEEKFKKLEDEYKKSEMQLSLGLISKADAKPKESAYYEGKAQLNKIKRAYDIQTMEFNKSIGVDSNTKYTGFKSDNRVKNPGIKTYDEYLDLALIKRAEILNNKEYIELKKFEHMIVRGLYPLTTDEYNKDAVYYISEAEDKLETDKIDISIEVNRLYNDLQNKAKKLESVNKGYDLAKKEYDKALQKYNLGVISKVDLNPYSVEFKTQQNNLNVSERDIWLAQLNLEYACNLGCNVSK